MPAGLPATLPTTYVDAITNYQTGQSDFENRKDQYKALEAFIRSSSALLSQGDIANQKKSFERPVKIPVVKRIAISLVDGRVCNLDGQEPSTDMLAITFSVKGFRIKVSRNMLENNYVGAMQLLAQARYHGWHAWYEWMENNCANYLETNKSTALKVDGGGYFTITGNAYVAARGVDYYAAVRYIMQRNLLSANGQLLDVNNLASEITKVKMGMYGPQNSVNQAALIGGADPYPSFAVTPGTGYGETHYLFPIGAVGIYHWLSPNAANNTVLVPQNDMWWSEKDPIFNYFDTSVHHQAKCEEKTIGYGGAVEPVYYDYYEYTIDPAFAKQYSSVAGETPIIKFNLT